MEVNPVLDGDTNNIRFGVRSHEFGDRMPIHKVKIKIKVEIEV